MPPMRWQPSHLACSIGATSRSKVGEAACPRAAARAASGTPSASAAPARAASFHGLRMRVICTPKLAQKTAELADGTPRAQRLSQRREEVRVRLGDPPNLGERRLCVFLRPLGSDAGSPLMLSTLPLRVDLEQLDPLSP